MPVILIGHPEAQVRDPERIDRILEVLRAYWVANPDLRLAQIIVNAANPRTPAPEVFYVEDEVIEAKLANAIRAGQT